MKPWKLGMKMSKVIVEQVLVWIRLLGLDLKYWGQPDLTKTTRLVGKPVKANIATTMKEKLMYPRVMVEVLVNKTYLDSVLFENEMGEDN